MDEKQADLVELEKAIEQTKRQILELASRKEQLVTDNKICFFVPHPKQELFFDNCERKRRSIFAGNRFGKTTLGVIEDISWLIGFRPFYPEGHPLRYKGIPDRPVKILVLASDWDNVKELFTENSEATDKKGKFFEWCPPHVIARVEKNSMGVINVIHTESTVKGRIRRSSIYFDTVKSFITNGLSHESKDWDAIHVDEPIPRELWIATSRGLIDRHGSAWWMLTPLREPWMFNDVQENIGHPEYWSIQASMEDNPTLDEQAIALFLKDLDPIELDCRRRGIPLAFGNLVIATYDERTHLWDKEQPPVGWKDWLTPPKDYYCAYAVDTHPQTPTAVLFVAIAPTGQIFFFHELWIGGIKKDRISEVCAEIKLVTKNLRIGYELVEPAAWSEDPETGRSFADVFYENGLQVERASKQRTFAIQQMRMLFGQRDRSVFIFPHLKIFRKELKTWYFTKDNKPADKDDHMCECAGRLIVHENLQWVAPARQISNIIRFDDTSVSLDQENQMLASMV